MKTQTTVKKKGFLTFSPILNEKSDLPTCFHNHLTQTLYAGIYRMNT